MKKKLNSEAKRQVVEELHKPARLNFKRRRVIIKSLNDLLQADLVEMIPYEKENRGYKYILVVINCFSKYVWAFPLKNKSAHEVCSSMEKVFKVQKFDNLQTDMGREFFNKDFKALTNKYRVNHYNTFSEKKASIVERVNRTLKNMMWKEFSFNGNYKWVDLLPKIVKKYNNTKHSTIKMRPSEVTKRNEKYLLQTAYNHIKMVGNINPKLKLADHVRISKIRGVFDKKYMPNWSTEIFTIRKVNLTNPITYLLQDEHEKPISGAFYRYQLQKVKYPNVYLVEKVLKRKKDKVYVRWLGFNSKHDSWISKDNIA